MGRREKGVISIPKAPRALTVLCALAICGSAAAAQDQLQQRIVREHIQQNGPHGWFGVTVSDNGRIDDEGNPTFEGYPVVTGVEPGSPAEKAGVRIGDVLVEFNSHDMRGNALALRDLLQPGMSFVVRLRRENATTMVRGIVGRRPPGFGEHVELIWTAPGEAGMAPLGAHARMMVRTPTPMPVGLPPVLLPNAFAFGGGIYPFAGAEFTPLNADLSEVLGVKPEGVFVTSVAAGSPARVSGLRGGDVVLIADSIRLKGPMALVHAITASGDRTIRLQIIRKRKPGTVILRW